MEKLFVLVFCIISFCSCVNSNNTELDEEQTRFSYESNGITVDKQSRIVSGYHIEEVTYEGNTHEILVNSGLKRVGIMHWPDCKYCKK